MPFGDKLKQLRQIHKLTQKEMSDKLHMEQSSYSKYENNKIVPTADVITRVQEKFQVSADWLLQPDGNSVTFQGNVNQGNGFVQAKNFYAVPQELMDTWLQQQKMMEAILQKLMEKL
jgi:transcriptional regulator with XRE-family HTH domain